MILKYLRCECLPRYPEANMACLMHLSFQMSERRRTPVPSRALLILSGALGDFFAIFKMVVYSHKLTVARKTISIR